LIQTTKQGETKMTSEAMSILMAEIDAEIAKNSISLSVFCKTEEMTEIDVELKCRKSGGLEYMMIPVVPEVVPEVVEDADAMPKCFGNPKSLKRCYACEYEDDCRDDRESKLAIKSKSLVNVELIDVVTEIIEIEATPEAVPEATTEAVPQKKEKAISLEIAFSTEFDVSGFRPKRRPLAVLVAEKIAEKKPNEFKQIREICLHEWRLFYKNEPTYFAVQEFTRQILIKIFSSEILDWENKNKTPKIINWK